MQVRGAHGRSQRRLDLDRLPQVLIRYLLLAPGPYKLVTIPTTSHHSFIFSQIELKINILAQ